MLHELHLHCVAVDLRSIPCRQCPYQITLMFGRILNLTSSTTSRLDTSGLSLGLMPRRLRMTCFAGLFGPLSFGRLVKPLEGSEEKRHQMRHIGMMAFQFLAPDPRRNVAAMAAPLYKCNAFTQHSQPHGHEVMTGILCVMRSLLLGICCNAKRDWVAFTCKA